MNAAALRFIYAWDRQGRKGQPCEVSIRARAMNSCLVRFADGYTMVTSRNAIRKNKAVVDARVDAEERL
jgi:hypothetical protein